MNNYSFLLEGSTFRGRRLFANGNARQRKHTCPRCLKKSLVRYVDGDSCEYLPEQYGKCDHSGSCGYFFDPYTDKYKAMGEFSEAPEAEPKGVTKSSPSKKIAPTVFIENIIPHQVLDATQKGWQQNVFLHNLQFNIPYPFEPSEIEKVRSLYMLGTVTKGLWAGAMTIPFIDLHNEIRAIQVKTFDSDNHTLRTTFLHTICESHYKRTNNPQPQWLTHYLANPGRVTCLCGEHLLQQYPYNPICLVEAPKSAIIGTLYTGIPKKSSDCIWLAVYNLTSLTSEKCRVLQGRYVTLFPDLSPKGDAFALWAKRADEFNREMENTHFEISSLLEKMATPQQRAAAEDVADFLVRYDWRSFRDKNTGSIQTASACSNVTVTDMPDQPSNVDDNAQIDDEMTAIGLNASPIMENWKNELNALQLFFDQNLISELQINLDGSNCCITTKFIRSHLEFIRHNNGRPASKPYLLRLKKIQTFIINKLNPNG